MLSASAAQAGIGEEDALRADLYDFLGALLARPPSKDLLEKAAGLTGDDTPLGRATGALARIAATTGERAAKVEFEKLFVGLGRGELLPYASFYMTGFLNEKPLAMLRNEMGRLGIVRAPNVFEPEDNIASICEMMAGLIRGRFFVAADLQRQREFFNRFAAPWAGHFFDDLAGAKNSVLYAPVGAIGATFMEIEREAFRMAGGSN
ncbi:molecular chaperone TorD family protein [Pikeienuella piscinae]|uniref:Molecular chaperone TorD family protein n=1 Tax=Pikeienuella piscinae TaxID=2748098 RepID=A0A7L5BZC0_9RHOB|nr:molecular chaperone TorD family protein [Pikeienuella piscinae]QIE55606.1 molecular chaperone TorD family protein [Pikeienuella piscinae]